jgi:hypothetical protein
MTQQKKTKKANKTNKKINYVTASPEESKGIREGIQEILEGKTISFEDFMKSIEAKQKKSKK